MGVERVGFEIVPVSDPYAVVSDPDLGDGWWTVVNLETGRVAEPARLWPTREGAIAAVAEQHERDADEADRQQRWTEEMARIAAFERGEGESED
ncbi:MAG TPA: hypothetical protein VHQ42_04635 [Candidatus Limnocylindria bacterium]|nr:hypothetical protein [Candidatus Limnocylindria bacterium]